MHLFAFLLFHRCCGVSSILSALSAHARIGTHPLYADVRCLFRRTNYSAQYLRHCVSFCSNALHQSSVMLSIPLPHPYNQNTPCRTNHELQGVFYQDNIQGFFIGFLFYADDTLFHQSISTNQFSSAERTTASRIFWHFAPSSIDGK